jgi:cellulose biosynthesis protein BcsQ
MQVLLIDISPDARATLLGRSQEGLRQAEVRKVELIEADLNRLNSGVWDEAVGALIGPGCYENLEEIIEQARACLPAGSSLGVVLENEVYAAEAVILRKRLGVPIIALGDLVQIAGFILDCESRRLISAQATKNRGVVGLAQMKGGVGTTTLAVSFAACWARHGYSVAMIDLDDVNPQLTAWARVGVVQRTVTSELLRQGEVPVARINELVYPVEGFEGRLVVVGQPDNYNEGFHFKANVLDGAPSAAEFIHSLLTVLKGEFDIIVIDLARSWGVSTFASLPHCDHIALVTDDDGMSVRRSLDGLSRLRKESDDPDEFDLTKWSLILNAYTGSLVTPKDLANEAQQMDLFSAQSSLYTIPFSESGRLWGGPGQSLYDLAEPANQQVIRKVAYNLVPFRFEAEDTFANRMKKKWYNLTHPS